MATLQDYRDERLRKLTALRELGIDPYPAHTERTHDCATGGDAVRRTGWPEGDGGWARGVYPQFWQIGLHQAARRERRSAALLAARHDG